MNALTSSIDSATMIRQIHESVMYAIARAETDGEVTSVMPADVFEAYGLPEDAAWKGEELYRLRVALWAHLGNLSIIEGKAVEFMQRYRHIDPHEFKSPENPSVSVYLTYVHNGGQPSYIKYEVGPAGGYPVDDVPV